MDPRRRQPRFGDAPADDFPHLLRTLELLQQKEASPQLERRVRVRPNRPSDIMLFGKFLRVPIEFRLHAPRVEHLDGIHLRQDFEQIFLLPRAISQPVEGMRHADERPLLLQPLDRLLRGQKRRDFLGHERSKELPSRGHDLLAHDDQFQVQSLSRQRPSDRIVIGDHHPVDPLVAARLDKFTWRCERILRKNGVTVKFDGKHGAILPRHPLAK